MHDNGGLIKRAVRRIWWDFAWKSMLIGMVVGYLISMFGAAVQFAGGPSLWKALSSILILIAQLPLTYLVLRSSLRKDYSAFRVRFEHKLGDKQAPGK
jgi:hypothetical protein